MKRARTKSPLPFLKLAIVLCPRFTATPMACFTDTLRLAADYDDNSRQIYFQWAYASAATDPVASSCGFQIKPNIDLAEIAEFDCIVVSGGLLSEFDTINPNLYNLLREANARSVPIIGLCTGSFVLAEAGLLNGKQCALQTNVLQDFVTRYSDAIPVTDKNYIIADNIVTCPGGIASIDIAGHIVEKYGNSARAFKALNYMLFERERSAIKLKHKPYQEDLNQASTLTVDAVHLMEVNLDRPFPIDELAKALNTTRSRLHRIFLRDMKCAPSKFWMTIRLNAAREILLGSTKSVTEIAYETGFSDAAHFCKSFKSHFGQTPKSFHTYQP